MPVQGAAQAEQGNGIKGFFQQLGEGFFDLVIAVRNRADLSEDEKNLEIMRIARDVAMQPGGLAQEYMDHFLDNTGTEKVFDTLQLLAQDPDVRRRLTSECVRRGLGIQTEREKTQDPALTAEYNREITIFQKTYANQDWKFALGTFGFRWSVVNLSVDSGRIFVKVWGENVYRWHGGEDRVTRCIHEAADALVAAGKAAPFTMRAKPAILVLSTFNPDLLEGKTLKQVNPNNSGSEWTLFGLGQHIVPGLRYLAGAGLSRVGQEVDQMRQDGEAFMKRSEQAVERWYRSL